MPGRSHTNILASQVTLDLIKSTVAEGLIVSAWCTAVRVLAKANVIDGKNVTGDADYRVEYENAGATFFESVPPITDGNIVTSVRSRFYRTEICESIAAAIEGNIKSSTTLTSATSLLNTTEIDTTSKIIVSSSEESSNNAEWPELAALVSILIITINRRYRAIKK